jgi:hypothetical protein
MGVAYIRQHVGALLAGPPMASSCFVIALDPEPSISYIYY